MWNKREQTPKQNKKDWCWPHTYALVRCGSWGWSNANHIEASWSM